MVCHGTWKFSWPSISTVASFVILASLVNFFQPNYLSSSLNGSIRTIRGIFVGNSDEVRFPVDSHGAVNYRGAPWNAKIGRWLANCDSASAGIDVIELISGKDCKSNCNSQGVCNKELGQCRCFLGFDGDDCSEKLKFNCNLPAIPGSPYGPWVFSICGAYCDTTRSFCYCGPGSKYPDRQVHEACGFETISKPGEPIRANLSKLDEDLFTTDGSKYGWCNVDPEEGYANKVKYKQGCGCRYDGQSGLFCEIPTVSTCINQCSGHGHCRGGFCQCYSGWYGLDCSVPSVSSPVKDWPRWLKPSKLEVSDNSSANGPITNLNITVKKRRPLIYVYDLPPQFNSHLLEGRHTKDNCVNRLYSNNNRTEWTGWPYGAQISLYESILASPYRTLNGEEADYFYVPVYDSCVVIRADDSPHFSMKDHMFLRSFFTLDMKKKAYDHIIRQYPYWNRTSGRDHIWFFTWDEGACFAPKEIWNSMMLVHWGNTNSKHNHSTTAYDPDNWDPIPLERRGNHSCFDPDKDLVLPSWNNPDIGSITSKLLYRPRQERKTFFYFNGNLGPAYPNGRPEITYSMGIRMKVAEEFGSVPDKDGQLGRQHEEDVTVTPVSTHKYHTELADSIFCGVFPGDGWSARMEASILQGCIPVIIQDGIFLPYENVFNYKSFAVRIPEDDIPDMIKILRRINETEIQFMMENVRSIANRFYYRDSMLLEAERQKALFNEEPEWATVVSKLEGDDVFATFIQVLNYKLHNDPWRASDHGERQ